MLEREETVREEDGGSSNDDPPQTSTTGPSHVGNGEAGISPSVKYFERILERTFPASFSNIFQGSGEVRVAIKESLMNALYLGKCVWKSCDCSIDLMKLFVS